MSQPKTIEEFVAQVAPKLKHPVRIIHECYLPADTVAHYDCIPDAIFCGTKVYDAVCVAIPTAKHFGTRAFSAFSAAVTAAGERAS